MPNDAPPMRIQRSRKKGWRKPEGAIIVTRPSFWGNPFRIGDWMTVGDPRPGGIQMSWSRKLIYEPADELIAKAEGFTKILDATQSVLFYKKYASTWNASHIARCKRELGGHDLACWCPLPEPHGHDCCHAAVLLEISNS
jgi:hypothetical protein